MDCLDFAAFEAAPLKRTPFEYLVLPAFVKPEACKGINADYPQLQDVGSFPLHGMTYGPAFQTLVDALESDEMRSAFERKFNLDLTDRPTTITVRGRCGTRDGNIHTDSASKIITVLIYLNPAWQDGGGRLRLLRGPKDIEDYFEEVPPLDGTLVAFKRSENSWHGHNLHIGERRVVQFNWVTGKGSQGLAMLRHRISASVKGALHAVLPGGDRGEQM